MRATGIANVIGVILGWVLWPLAAPAAAATPEAFCNQLVTSATRPGTVTFNPRQECVDTTVGPAQAACSQLATSGQRPGLVPFNPRQECVNTAVGPAQAICNALSTTGTRPVQVSCNPQQQCRDAGIAGAICNALPTSGNPRTECSRAAGVLSGACNVLPDQSLCIGQENYNPRQVCVDTTVGPAQATCNALSTSGTRPGTETFNPRQVCVDTTVGAAQATCNALSTSGTRPGTATFNPRQECLDAIRNASSAQAGCNALPTSATRPGTETFNPRQECLNRTPPPLPGLPSPCDLLPTSATRPGTVTYNPRAECLAFIAQGVGLTEVALYKIFMAELGAGVSLHRLPGQIVEILRPVYPDANVAGARFGFANRQPANHAITDCTIMYFNNQEVVSQLSEGRLSKGHLHWVLHELRHTGQCRERGGRDGLAKMWFSQIPLDKLRAINPKTDLTAEWRRLHDAMPMEGNADSVATRVMNALEGCCIEGGMLVPPRPSHKKGR